VAEGWLALISPGCPPAARVDVREGDRNTLCAATTSAALDFLRARPNIHTVVIATLTTPYFNNARPSPYSRDGLFHIDPDPSGRPANTIFFDGLSETIGTLLWAGKRVVLMIDIPELDFSPARCHQRPLQGLLAPPEALRCTLPQAAYLERNQAFREMVAVLQKRYPALLVYDPRNVFCDGIACAAVNDGQPLYRDQDHLSVSGSDFASAAFLAWLKAQAPPADRKDLPDPAAIK